jgi:hypothetical protein
MFKSSRHSGVFQYWPTALRVLPLFVLLLPCSLQAKDRIDRGDRVALIVPENQIPQVELTLEDVTNYLHRSLDVVVRRYPVDTKVNQIAESVCIAFGTRQDNSAIDDALKATGATTKQLGNEGGLIHSLAVGDKLLVILTGDTPRGACHAAYSFLEQEVGIGFFIDGDRIPRPESIALKQLHREEIPVVPIRGIFYHYIWKHPHANNWRLWSWERWQSALDWMRRKRFNVLPIFHDEGGYLWGDVIFKAFPEIKKNDKTLAQFVVDPTWRTELNHKIFQHARASGIQIAYNLFYSQVPEFFADFHPELKYHPLNMRNLGISAQQPQCKEIMRRYWKAILETHGIDNSHLYFICPYAHEKPLPEYYPNHNAPALQAIDVVKELDPQARIFMESWCWKYRHEREAEKTIPLLTSNANKEWEVFDKELPRDIGVAEWDLKRMHESLPAGFNGRPYVQLTHTTMEGQWPPQTARTHPQWMINFFGNAIDHGAQGVLVFHILANTNEILADLSERVCWKRRPEVKEFYGDYARRRFGPDTAAAMAQSIELFCDSVDLGAGPSAPYNFSLALSFPGFFRSAESHLAECQETGEARKKWLQDRITLMEAKAAIAARAILSARSVAAQMHDEPFFDRYMFELDYVAGRFEGIIQLYRAHLVAGENPELAEQHFQRALAAFRSVKELFRHDKGYHMSAIQELEPTVPFTAGFLADWETRGYWEPRSRWFHIVWERMNEFERIVEGLRPR